MKWIISYLLISAILFQQSSCKEDPPKPLTELEKLPPETKSGKYTFGCLINGKAFVTNSTVDSYAVFQQSILQITGEIDYPLQWVGITLIENGNTIESETISSETETQSSVKNKNCIKEFSVKLRDSNGDLRKTGSTQTGKIILDVVNLTEGTYYLEIATKENIFLEQILLKR